MAVDGEYSTPLPATIPHHNYTRSDTELFLLTAWTAWSLGAALIGNTLILVGVYSRAFRIDKLSLMTIKNLAVSDIYFNIIWVLPTLITLLNGNTWVLGQGICNFTTYLQYPPAIATIFFITLISVNKWMRCQFPLKTLDITTKTAYKITIGIWSFSFLHPSAYFISNLIKTDDLRYMELDLYKGSCDYHHGPDLAVYWNGVDLTCALVCCMAPSVILLASNAAILYIVKKKGRGNVRVSNLLMIVCLTYLFFVSYMPYTVKYLMPFLVSDPNILPDQFVVMTYFLLYVNSWANVFIYYFTNTSFKKFVLRVLKCGEPQKTTTTSIRIFEKSRLAHIDRVRQTQIALKVQKKNTPPAKTRNTSVVVIPQEICPQPMTLDTCKLAKFEVIREPDVVSSVCEDTPSSVSLA